MALEIISRGTDPGEVSLESACGNCDTVFRAAEDDFSPYTQSTGPGWVRCPVCGSFLDRSGFRRVDTVRERAESEGSDGD